MSHGDSRAGHKRARKGGKATPQSDWGLFLFLNRIPGSPVPVQTLDSFPTRFYRTGHSGPKMRRHLVQNSRKFISAGPSSGNARTHGFFYFAAAHSEQCGKSEVYTLGDDAGDTTYLFPPSLYPFTRLERPYINCLL